MSIVTKIFDQPRLIGGFTVDQLKILLNNFGIYDVSGKRKHELVRMVEEFVGEINESLENVREIPHIDQSIGLRIVRSLMLYIEPRAIAVNFNAIDQIEFREIIQHFLPFESERRHHRRRLLILLTAKRLGIDLNVPVFMGIGEVENVTLLQELMLSNRFEMAIPILTAGADPNTNLSSGTFLEKYLFLVEAYGGDSTAFFRNLIDIIVLFPEIMVPIVDEEAKDVVRRMRPLHSEKLNRILERLYSLI